MIGQTISHYRIVEKLGQGGMGVVYKAKDLRLDRHVAVKLLPHDKILDSDRKRHFVREAKAASALNHPNIVTIYDIDESGDSCFIVMEYVSGKTLQAAISDGGLSLEQSLSYGIQIADAMAKAHSEGIIHRDLKPSNVMITDGNLVKVLDFGLAKLTRRAAIAISDEEITRSIEMSSGDGVIQGTLPYMSPEQARGQELDFRTDIFSLGTVMYNMVAGQTPFRGIHAAAVLDSLLHSPTPSLRIRYPDIPDALEQTIERATAKDPSDRYQSMQALAADLRCVSNAVESTHLRPPIRPTMPPGLSKAKKILHLRLPIIISAAAILLVLFAALLFRSRLPRWMGGTVLPKQIRLAVLPFNNIGSNRDTQAISDGLMEILSTKFNQTQQFQNALNIVPATEVRSENVLSPSHARRAFGANLVLTGSVQKIFHKLLLTINLVDAVNLRQIDGEVCTASEEDLLALQEEAFIKASAMLELNLSRRAQKVLRAGESRIPAAYNAYLKAVGYLARYDKPENIENSINLFQQAIREDADYALAHAGLGEAYWRKYRRTKEARWADAALSSCLRAAEINRELARVHVILGIVYTGTGNPAKGLVELKLAISLEPGNAEAYRELARSHEALGNIKEAEEAYRTAIRLKPDSWPCYWNIGAFYYRRSQYDEAAKQFREVIRLAPDHYRAYSSLGGIYIYQGDFKKAANMFRTSLDIRPTPQAYSNLAASYILQGRRSEAAGLLEKAVAMDSPSYEVWGNLADVYNETPGMKSKAAGAYEKAADLAKTELAVNPGSPARANIALYLIRMGNKKQALDEIKKARELLPKDQNVLFWSAVVYELAGDRKSALSALAAAAEGGYSLALIRAVSDLNDLRKDPRYYRQVERREPSGSVE